MTDGQPLKPYIDTTVSVITNDGRQFVGTLRGFDQAVNLILDECHERVYKPDGIESEALGLYVIRGDNVAVVGDIDDDRDSEIDLTKIRAAPLKPVTH